MGTWSWEFFFSPWKEALKKTKVKLDLFTGTNMVLMVEKGI